MFLPERFSKYAVPHTGKDSAALLEVQYFITGIKYPADFDPLKDKFAFVNICGFGYVISVGRDSIAFWIEFQLVPPRSGRTWDFILPDKPSSGAWMS